jgi:serine/threonine protein kinase
VVRKDDNKEFVFKRVSGQTGARRMRREIDVQSTLVHEHIMPLVDWDFDNFTWYVMPRGTRTMSELTPPIAQDLILRIVDSVASALEVAHGAGYPHRDVKPANILALTDEARCRALGFGRLGAHAWAVGKDDERADQDGPCVGNRRLCCA